MLSETQVMLICPILGILLAFALRRMCVLWWEHKWHIKPLFRCSGCHKDIYPPVIKSMHHRDKSYCAECEAKYWGEGAEALRVRWALGLVEGSISETLEPK